MYKNSPLLVVVRYRQRLPVANGTSGLSQGPSGTGVGEGVMVGVGVDVGIIVRVGISVGAGVGVGEDGVGGVVQAARMNTINITIVLFIEHPWTEDGRWADPCSAGNKFTLA